MRHVPIAQFKDRVSEYVAEASAGEEIVITRHGKPSARLLAATEPDEARRERTKNALDQLAAIRGELRARGMTATIDEMIAWKNEGQR